MIKKSHASFWREKTKTKFPVYHIYISSFMTYHCICNQINKTGVTSGAGTAYSCQSTRILVGFVLLVTIALYVCFVDRCLYLFSFFFWPFCCLSFFDLQIMFTPLVSSNLRTLIMLEGWKQKPKFQVQHIYSYWIM